MPVKIHMVHPRAHILKRGIYGAHIWMERKHHWKQKEREGNKAPFWGKCLKFDLACACLLACLVVCGIGKGETVRQGILSEASRQKAVWDAPAGTGQNSLQLQQGKSSVPTAQAQDGGGTAGGKGTEGEMGAEGDVEKKKVAITFDDGPHPQYTPEMLAGLKERNVKATFFLLGQEVEKYPELVKQIQEEGHLIGNHSYQHEQLSKLAMDQACAQVTRTNDLIYGITGVYPAYLRPPFGDWHKELDCKVNMVEVLWDVDTRDWSIQDHGKIVEKALKDVQDNAIILMHDGYETSVTAAMEIIDTLQKQGYEFVTVDEMIFD